MRPDRPGIHEAGQAKRHLRGPCFGTGQAKRTVEGRGWTGKRGASDGQANARAGQVGPDRQMQGQAQEAGTGKTFNGTRGQTASRRRNKQKRDGVPDRQNRGSGPTKHRGRPEVRWQVRWQDRQKGQVGQDRQAGGQTAGTGKRNGVGDRQNGGKRSGWLGQAYARRGQTQGGQRKGGRGRRTGKGIGGASDGQANALPGQANALPADRPTPCLRTGKRKGRCWTGKRISWANVRAP